MAPPTPTPSYTFGRRSAGVIAGLSWRALAGALAALVLVVLPVALLAGVLPALMGAALVAAVAWCPPRTRDLLVAHLLEPLRSARASEATDPEDPFADPVASPFGEVEVSEVNGVGVGRVGDSKLRAVTWRLEPIVDFALLGDDEAERCVVAWGDRLDALAASGEVKSVSWTVTTVADRAGDPTAWLLEHASTATPEAIADYAGALDSAAALARRDILVTIVVAPRTDSPSALAGAIATVDRRVRSADLAGARVTALSTSELTAALEEATRPDAATLPDAAPGTPALASWWAEDVDSLDVGSWHTRALAISELPRVPAPVDWLWPLLSARPAGSERTTVTVHMEAVPAWRALRSAEVAVTSAESELRRRERAGFSTRSRDVLALAAQAQREEEVAAGHATWRVRAQVTVSARAADRAATAEQDALAAIRRARSEAWVPAGHALDAWRASAPLGLPPPAPVVQATTRQVRSLFPGQVAARGDAGGLVVGVDTLSAGPFTFEPFEAYSHGDITSPNLVVIGQVGKGKSSFVKALCGRGGGVLGRRVIVLDPKGEYASLAARLGLSLLALRPAGSVRLNPLAAPASLPAQERAAMRLDLLAALAGAQLGRDLDPIESAALGWLARELPATSTLGAAVGALLDPPVALAEALRLDVTGALDALRALGLALDALVSGHLSGMFDGEATIDLEAEDRGLVVDLSAAWDDHDALAPVLAAALATVSAAVATTPQPTYLVVDEAWAVLSGGIDFLRSTAKLSRQFAVSLIIVLHRLSDLAAAADDASAIAKRAQGLFADAETVVAFGQPPTEAAVLGAALDLSTREVDQLSRLRRGQALAVTGSSHRLVEIVLTDAEAVTTDTDTAMRAALGPGGES